MDSYPVLRLSHHTGVAAVVYTQGREGNYYRAVIDVAVHSSKKLVFYATSKIPDPENAVGLPDKTRKKVSRQIEIFAANENHECFFHHPFRAADSNEVKSVVVVENNGVMAVGLSDQGDDLDFKATYGVYVPPEFNPHLIAEGITVSNNKVTYTMVFQRTLSPESTDISGDPQ